MSTPFAPFFALVAKDVRLYFSNRRAVLTTLIAPIVIAAFFGSLFGPSRSPSNIPLMIANGDRSPLTDALIRHLQADPALKVTLASASAVRGEVSRGHADAAIVIPADFGQNSERALFGRTSRPVLDLVYDPSKAMVLGLVRGLVSEHLMQAMAETLRQKARTPGALTETARKAIEQSTTLPAARRKALLDLLSSADRVSASDNAASEPPGSQASDQGFELPFTLNATQAVQGEQADYNSYAHSFAGMGVQFILFMGIELGVGLLLARRMGLWKRLRAAPLSKATLLGSRVVSGTVIALVLMSVIYLVALLAFGVRIRGSVAGFLAVIATFSLMTSCFGLLLAALGKTPEATRGLAVFATLLLVMLGGAWVPAFIFPAWLQTASKLTPTRWAVDGLDAMTWRGLGFDAAVMPIAVMLLFSVGFALLALWRFRWEEA